MNNRNHSIFFGIVGLVCYAVTGVFSALDTQLNNEIFFGVSAILMFIISYSYKQIGDEEC